MQRCVVLSHQLLPEKSKGPPCVIAAAGSVCAVSLSTGGGVDKVTECLLTLSLAAFGGLESLWKIILGRQEQELRIHWRNEAALCWIQKHLPRQLPLSI